MNKYYKEKYNFEFDSSFDFEAAPVPPGLSNDRMVGLHLEWDVSLCGLILSRDVRETLWECYKTFPHFAAPELLTSDEFLKFVYYSKLYHLKYLPPNYLPVKYRHSPKEWEAIESHYRGEAVESDAARECDDQQKKIMAGTKIPYSPLLNDGVIGQSSKPIISLLDFDMNVRTVIATFLDSSNWLSLRTSCRDALGWPVTNVDFDFIYFAIDCWHDDNVWHGVAHTLIDVLDAFNSVHVMKKDDHYFTWIYPSHDYKLHIRFIKFDREKHSVVPLMKFNDRQPHQGCEVPHVHDLGMSYFGVKNVVPLSASLQKHGFYGCQSYDDGEIALSNAADVKRTFHNLSVYFRNLKPKERMKLEHVGIRQLHCSRCGNRTTFDGCWCHVPPGSEDGNECVMFYSPRWFDDGKNRLLCSGPGSEAAGNKSWIVFADAIRQWR